MLLSRLGPKTMLGKALRLLDVCFSSLLGPKTMLYKAFLGYVEP